MDRNLSFDLSSTSLHSKSHCLCQTSALPCSASCPRYSSACRKVEISNLSIFSSGKTCWSVHLSLPWLSGIPWTGQGCWSYVTAWTAVPLQPPLHNLSSLSTTTVCIWATRSPLSHTIVNKLRLPGSRPTLLQEPLLAFSNFLRPLEVSECTMPVLLCFYGGPPSPILVTSLVLFGIQQGDRHTISGYLVVKRKTSILHLSVHRVYPSAAPCSTLGCCSFSCLLQPFFHALSQNTIELFGLELPYLPCSRTRHVGSPSGNEGDEISRITHQSWNL